MREAAIGTTPDMNAYLRKIDPRNIELPDPEVIAALRSMTGHESLRQALAAHGLGRRLVESGVRGDHPEWSDHQVQIEIVRRMLGDEAAEAAQAWQRRRG